MADNNIPPPAWLQDWLTQRGATSLLPTQSQPPQIAVDSVGLFKALGPTQTRMFPTLINDDSSFPGDGNIDSFGEGTGVGSGTSIGDTDFGQPVGANPGLFSTVETALQNEIDTFDPANMAVNALGRGGTKAALGALGVVGFPATVLSFGLWNLIKGIFGFGEEQEEPDQKVYDVMPIDPFAPDSFYSTYVPEPDERDPFVNNLDYDGPNSMSMSQTDPAGHFPSMEDFGGMGPESDEGMDADEEGEGMDD